jgi:hypothetical protein
VCVCVFFFRFPNKYSVVTYDKSVRGMNYIQIIGNLEAVFMHHLHEMHKLEQIGKSVVCLTGRPFGLPN